MAAASELEEPVWSVISFEKVEAMNLTYSEAYEKLGELDKQGMAGLCIVTNQAAIRLDPEETNV